MSNSFNVWASEPRKESFSGREIGDVLDGSCTEDLFSIYHCPTSISDIPYSGGRTLDVDAQAWKYYIGEAPLNPSSRLQRLASTALERFRPSSKRGATSCFGLPILSPAHRLVRTWDGVMTAVDMTYTAFLTSISLAFDQMEGGAFTWLTWMDVAGTSFYLIDIFVGFHVAFVARYDVRQVLVFDGFKVAYYYSVHGQFLVNLIACLPIVPQIITSALPSTTSVAFKAFYALRLLRMLRVMRLMQMVWGASLLHNPVSRTILTWSNTATLYILTVLLTLAILVNLLGCIWWFVAELEGLENSWAASNGYKPDGDLVTASAPVQWVASVFYVMTTMTTVGYGDISPVTVAEQCVAMLFMVFSIFYFGFVVNVVGDLIHYASRTARTGDVLRNKLEDMDAWMAERHLSQGLKEKVRQYYVDVWAQHTGAGMPEADYFNELPVALRGEIVLSLADDALSQSHMFRHLSREVRANLAAAAVPVRLVAGHNLYREGDDADGFFILQEGEAMAIHGMSCIAQYHSPALLGQAAVFAEHIPECRQRLNTVRATTNCTLWSFSSRLLLNLASHHREIMVALCSSYLLYLDHVTSRSKLKGRAPPAHLMRMRKKVAELRSQYVAQVEEVDDWYGDPEPDGGGSSSSSGGGGRGVPLDAQGDAGEGEAGTPRGSGGDEGGAPGGAQQKEGGGRAGGWGWGGPSTLQQTQQVLLTSQQAQQERDSVPGAALPFLPRGRPHPTRRAPAAGSDRCEREGGAPAGHGMIGEAAAFGEGEQLEDATWAQRTQQRRQQLEEEGGGEVQLHMETGYQGEQG